jgi:hypothetical protein
MCLVKLFRIKKRTNLSRTGASYISHHVKTQGATGAEPTETASCTDRISQHTTNEVEDVFPYVRH